MTKTITYCDHCGKELDKKEDYVDLSLDNFADWIDTDLCVECFNKLNDVVLQFVNK